MAKKQNYPQDEWAFDIRPMLEKRSEMLQSLIEELHARLKNVPDGRIHTIRHRNGYQFYLRHPHETNGHYIRKKDVRLIRSLAQKEYDTALLNKIIQENQYLTRYLTKFPIDPVRNTGQIMSPGILPYIKPVFMSDEEYIAQWLDFPYEKKGFDENYPEFYTSQNERVRSKSEILIANIMSELNIPYHYERPLFLPDRTVYPDFTALNVRKRLTIYIEHLGMLLNAEYCDHALKKIHSYESSGIYMGEQLILFYETPDQPLDTQLVRTKLIKYLL